MWRAPENGGGSTHGLFLTSQQQERIAHLFDLPSAMQHAAFIDAAGEAEDDGLLSRHLPEFDPTHRAINGQQIRQHRCSWRMAYGALETMGLDQMTGFVEGNRSATKQAICGDDRRIEQPERSWARMDGRIG